MDGLLLQFLFLLVKIYNMKQKNTFFVNKEKIFNRVNRRNKVIVFVTVIAKHKPELK